MQTPDVIKKFYHSAKWKRCRSLVIHKYHGRCKDCGKAGHEVHHIIPLTEQNVNNPYISLGLDNLELLCQDCHNAKRSDNNQVRSDLMFDSEGNLIPKKPYPPSEIENQRD